MLKTNALDLLRQQQRRHRSSRLIRELEAVAREFAPRFEEVARETQLGRIYLVPIPLSPRSGKPAWERTGGLLAVETAAAVSADVVMTNLQRYSVARRDLGTPQGRRIKSPGVQVVDWQRTAAERLGPELRRARRGAVIRVWATKGA